MKPLQGLLVLDFSQYLAGPSAALRLADLGARVIKIERTGVGDLCRFLTLSNLKEDGDSILFHTINRNKESYEMNLKEEEDLQKVKKLIEQADVLIQNFRPGIMERLGLDFETVKKINPRLVYGTVTGYGSEGPWVKKPGQDLLVQSVSGLAWLNGDSDQPPVPFGLSVADMFTGAHLVQGILALLVRRGVTGEGGLVEVSLLESVLDLQFEVLSTYLNDGNKLPKRSDVNNANAYLGAPYGIYETKNGFIALAMGSILELGKLLDCPKLLLFEKPDSWFNQRDEIKTILVEHLRTQTTEHWLDKLEPADYWCADVLNWQRLFEHDGFKALDMIQEVSRPNGSTFKTTRCPIRVDGIGLKAAKWAPSLGENNHRIEEEFDLTKI